MVALLSKVWKCMENFEQHYESEATEDWVCSGMISFKLPLVEREKKQSVFVFPTVNVYLEGDIAGS